MHVTVIGALDLRTADEIRSRIVEMIPTAGTPPAVVVDLKCCTNVDITGLTALADARTAARDRGGDLHLEGVPPLVEHLIHTHRLAGRLPTTGLADQPPGPGELTSPV